MKPFVLFFYLSCVSFLFAKTIPLTATQVCKQCHPLIYEEYARSMHANASLDNDPVHKAVWQKHPASKKNNYICKKCHAPTQKNAQDTKSAISCVYCHQIADIRHGFKSNENVLTTKKDTLYGARKGEANAKNVTFEKKKSFFGFVTKQSGSPYHRIDFSNKNYYSAKTCMGCHSHKRNKHGFALCRSEMPKAGEKTCIECHMPKVQGSFTTLRHTQTHRFHGFAGVANDWELLKPYVHLRIRPSAHNLQVRIRNEAPHPLFLHPMRLGELRVRVSRDGKTVFFASKRFRRVIGANDRPSPPWEAKETLQDTRIKAKETRRFSFDADLKKGDTIEVVFGFYKVAPGIAKRFGLQGDEASFRILKKVTTEFK